MDSNVTNSNRRVYGPVRTVVWQGVGGGSPVILTDRTGCGIDHQYLYGTALRVQFQAELFPECRENCRLRGIFRRPRIVGGEHVGGNLRRILIVGQREVPVTLQSRAIRDTTPDALG